MKHIIDPELIVLASPNYAYGNSLGLTDEESERSALETMDAMKKAYDKTLPMPPIRQSFRSIGRCGACDNGINTHKDYNHCGKCGQAIDWRDE